MSSGAAAGTAGVVKSGAGQTKIDYKSVLGGEGFAVFNLLRDERKKIAENEGVPVYTIFTNAQLVEMVQKKIISASAIQTLDGVGKVRTEKYGAQFIAILARAFNEESDGKVVES